MVIHRLRCDMSFDGQTIKYYKIQDGKKSNQKFWERAVSNARKQANKEVSKQVSK